MSKVKGPYIEFQESQRAGQATSQWHVVTKDANAFCLGVVKWFGRWRRYAFFPNAETVFEDECLKYIAGFIEARMDERREARRSANAG